MNHGRTLRQRPDDPGLSAELRAAGMHPQLARVLGSRGITGAETHLTGLDQMLDPRTLRGTEQAAELLSDAIDAGQRLCVVADYDCDGATACALAVRGLRGFGAQVDYLVPDRIKHGYGLSPQVVQMALAHPRLGRPDWLITVDNGIASTDGVAAARAHGLRTIVTDHHLAGPTLPAADAIVNPNQPGCEFASRHLAGVGVMFYVLIALRGLRRSLPGAARAEPELVALLDLLAVGTVADLVRLDRNNRILVAAGLRRMRAGRCNEGLKALMRINGIEPTRVSSRDIGFGIAPRINAAGRLANITTGIECLLTDEPDRAAAFAAELDEINRRRREIEVDMRAQALQDLPSSEVKPCIVICQSSWHEGVIGLVAGRVKDTHYRPVVAFAPAQGEPGMLRGSARSVAGVHIRDALETAANRNPGLIERYGGHAMAAGLSLKTDHLAAFEQAMIMAVEQLAEPGSFDEVIWHDGPLVPEDIDFELLDLLETQVWGQGFPAPCFLNSFRVLRQRVLRGAHCKLELSLAGRRYDAIAFGQTGPFPDQAALVYRLARNEWQGRSSIQLVIEAQAQPA